MRPSLQESRFHRLPVRGSWRGLAVLRRPSEVDPEASPRWRGPVPSSNWRSCATPPILLRLLRFSFPGPALAPERLPSKRRGTAPAAPGARSSVAGSPSVSPLLESDPNLRSGSLSGGQVSGHRRRIPCHGGGTGDEHPGAHHDGAREGEGELEDGSGTLLDAGHVPGRRGVLLGAGPPRSATARLRHRDVAQVRDAHERIGQPPQPSPRPRAQMNVYVRPIASVCLN